MLLERPGEIVTREELHSRLWPADTFVDFDHGLNAAVKRLRDALVIPPKTPRFIETSRARGYRLLAPVNGAARETTPAVPQERPPGGKFSQLPFFLSQASWPAGMPDIVRPLRFASRNDA